MKTYINIAFFLIAGVMKAQNTYSGKIVDNTNLPIPYANVLGLNETEEVITYVFSDDNGNFRLSIPQNKSIVKLKISLLGYEDKIIPIEEVSNFEIGTIQLNVSSANLDEVVITAERPLIERQAGKLVV
ncbi:MAG: carboxypeptidase-like regulatory domain-containing protein, partial [Weeksellaceae bacterium]